MLRRRVEGVLWLFALLLLGHRVLVWLSERWWFEALGQGETFARLFGWRAGTFLVFGALWLALIVPHARRAWRLVTRHHNQNLLMGGPERPPALERGLRLLSALTVWGGACGAALGASNRFELWVLAWHGSSWGESDAQTGVDLAFYIFTLPAWTWAWNWLGVALTLVFLGAIALYGATETLETGPRRISAPREVIQHLTSCAIALVLWLAVRLYLSSLAAPIGGGWSPESLFGPLEQNITQPLRAILAWSCIAVAVGIWWSAARERFALAVGLFFGWGLLVLLATPAAEATARSLGFVSASQIEESVEHHLRATREAWGLEAAPLDLGLLPSTRFGAEEVDANSLPGEDTGITAQPLWPREALAPRLTQDENRVAGPISLQRRGGEFVYRVLLFNPTQRSPLQVEMREARASSLAPSQIRIPFSFESVTLHQEASPLAELSEASEDVAAPSPRQNPALPPTVWREAASPRFGVNRSRWPVAFSLALRFGSSPLMRPGAPVTWHLTPLDRVKALYPWVNWERAIPRPFVTSSNNRTELYYQVDGALTSRFYPQAAPLPSRNAWRGINYARASVVAFVSAHSGATSLFLLDANEPLARAWRSAFPHAFIEARAMPVSWVKELEPSPSLLDAMAMIATRYSPSPLSEAEQAREWRERASIRQPLWGSGDGGSLWRQIAVPTQKPGDKEFQGARICALGPARTRVIGSPDALGSLALSRNSGADLLQRGGMPRLEWFVAPRPIRLPESAVEALPTIEERFRQPRSLIALEQTARVRQLTIWPRLNGRKVEALFFAVSQARRGDVTAPASSPSPVAAPTSPREETWQLSVEVGATEPFFGVSNGSQAATQTLERLRSVWRSLQEARRAGNWNEVARLEEGLNSALLAPAP